MIASRHGGSAQDSRAERGLPHSDGVEITALRGANPYGEGLRADAAPPGAAGPAARLPPGRATAPELLPGLVAVSGIAGCTANATCPRPVRRRAHIIPPRPGSPAMDGAYGSRRSRRAFPGRQDLRSHHHGPGQRRWRA